MRISFLLSAACAIAICTATATTSNAQQSATTPRSGTAQSKVPSGINFAYDAQHGQITSTGAQLKTSTVKSNSVSPTTGTVNILINFKLVSQFAAGTKYHCSAYLLGGLIDTDNGVIDGGVETVNGLANGNGGYYKCNFKVPYSWTLASDPGADSGLIIAFAASAVGTDGEVQHSTLQVDGIENLPANGASASFVYLVAL